MRLRKKKLKRIILLIILLIIISSGLLLFFNYEDRFKKELNTELKFTNQWALMNRGQTIEGITGKEGFDINAIDAWNITKGNSEVIVGILDTGIDISNSNISKSIFINKNEVPNNGIDDDKNGLVDDVNGWDFYNNDKSVYDYYLSDYHGTFITSLITGAHNDINKVWGVAPNVKVLPLKFMSGSSGSIDDAIKAIDYAYSMGARIINCSWDNTNFDPDLYETMKKYKDVLFICSSGNSHNDLNKTPVYPCSFDLDNVICVVAVDSSGEMYRFSGYGLENAVAAPGKDILGMLPEGDYLYSDGTSFATAYVTGIAALVKSQYIDISSADLAKILRISKKSVEKELNNPSSNEIIDAKIALEKASLLIKN